MKPHTRIIQNLKKTYCRIQRSTISGVGVIAIRDIARNTNPFAEPKPAKWMMLSKKELATLPKEVRQMVHAFYATEKNGDVDISELALNGMNISYFLNTSKRPNLRRMKNGNYKTVRKIKKGEELTTDYATFDPKYQRDDDQWVVRKMSPMERKLVERRIKQEISKIKRKKLRYLTEKEALSKYKRRFGRNNP